MVEELSAVGKRLPLKDAYEKVTGVLKFSIDISLPWMLYVKVLRSPYAHARIVKIDVTEAELLPGVEGVITYKDIPQEEWMEGLLTIVGQCWMIGYVLLVTKWLR